MRSPPCRSGSRIMATVRAPKCSGWRPPRSGRSGSLSADREPLPVRRFVARQVDRHDPRVQIGLKVLHAHGGVVRADHREHTFVDYALCDDLPRLGSASSSAGTTSICIPMMPSASFASSAASCAPFSMSTPFDACSPVIGASSAISQCPGPRRPYRCRQRRARSRSRRAIPSSPSRPRSFDVLADATRVAAEACTVGSRVSDLAELRSSLLRARLVPLICRNACTGRRSVLSTTDRRMGVRALPAVGVTTDSHHAVHCLDS